MRSQKNRVNYSLLTALLQGVILLLLAAMLVLLLFTRHAASKREQAESAAVSASSVPAATAAPEELTAGPAATPAPTAAPESTPVPEPKTFVISMVGDCTLAEPKMRRGWGSAYQSVVGTDYAYPFSRTVQYFEKDYLTIANLECDLSDKNYDSIEQFVFLAPAAYANILAEGSVEFATLANNHTMDFGANAYNDTRAALDAAGVNYAGEDETYLYQTDGGLKVGLYCLYNQLTYNAMSILSASAQEALVTAAKGKLDAAAAKLREAGAEFTIACLHMGREGYFDPTDTQYTVCRYAVDAGFNTVYCSHAHRLQPIESYHDGLIFYGLGNWSFGGNTNPDDYDTAILQISVTRTGDTVTLDGYSCIPCSISATSHNHAGHSNADSCVNDYCPTPYEEGSEDWNRVLAKLSGEYKGENTNIDYSGILSAMNG